VIVDETVRNFNGLLTIKNISSVDRVGALIHKLKEQYDQNVDKNSLLVTVQLLLAELEQEGTQNASREKVSVILPKVHRIQQDVPSVETPVEATPHQFPHLHLSPLKKNLYCPPDQPAPPVVDRPSLPDTIKSYALKPPPQPVQQPKPVKKEQSGDLFDQEEIPTLAHQKKEKEVYELNDVHIDGDSLNDKLKEDKAELGATLKADPVHDLRKAIGINDRYRFISELFRGDEDMYERSIKTINAFTTFAEAETWIQRELKVKIGWVDTNHTVKDFDKVVKRRFS
jgi:hypothetical protein